MEATVLGSNPGAREVDASAGVGAGNAEGSSVSGGDASEDATVDAGGGGAALDASADCCAVGQVCATSSDCPAAMGSSCVNGTCALPQTCAEIKARNPAAPDGTYTVEVRAAGGLAPFPVYCDMTTAGGGWTRVASEPAHSGGNHEGSLVYLGIPVGQPETVASASGPGLIGQRFNGTYRELAVVWGTEYARMTVSRDIFVNDVDVAIPTSGFVTNDPLLGGWVGDAGGAVFCRSSRATDVRPGDTSWALKPIDSIGTGCGCNDKTWRDRGAFYGGLLLATVCMSRGGGWAGVKSDGQDKAGITSATDLSLWIR